MSALVASDPPQRFVPLRSQKWLSAIAVLIASMLFCLSDAWAHYVAASGPENTYSRDRFALGVGAAIVRFDTNFRFTEKGSPISLFVDAEGTLGLPETDTAPVIYGNLRIAERHWLGFSFFQVRRAVTWFQLNESKDFNLGDLTIAAGANANITLSDSTSFYYLSYNYALFDDSRSIILLTFGLYGLDLEYVFDARGEITLNGVPVVEGSLTREASVFAPLPLLGFDAWYHITPKWAMGTKVSLVAGTYEEVTAALVDTTIRAKYQFSDHVGGSIGITYFNATIDIDKPDQIIEVNYGFDGAAIGLHFNF